MMGDPEVELEEEFELDILGGCHKCGDVVMLFYERVFCVVCYVCLFCLLSCFV